MNRIIGVTIVTVFLFLAVVLSVALACDKPICQPCSNAYELPGLWQMQLSGKVICGEVTIIGGSTALINDELLLLNKVKKMKRVEVCP